MKMNERPKLTLKKTPFEVIFNSITLLLFLISLAYLLFVWRALPLEVPAHYNALGEVDRWGSKVEMIIIPFFALLMWIGMTVLEKYPHVYNYMNLTPDNVRSQYINARLMMNVIKNIIVLLFVYLTWSNIQVALGNHDSLSSWFMPIFLVLLFIPMGYFIIRSFRLRK